MRRGKVNELELFAGAGGGILGGKLLGWRTVCAVEVDAAAREKLMARQNDGSLEPFPIWSDVRSFTARNNAVRPVIRALRRTLLF
jgi:DNA (cytosine-5)-methyltransferase 1